MIRKTKTSEELERLIVEHPVRACLHMRMGLLEEIKENGEDMIDAAGMAFEGLVYLAKCIIIALRHMVMLIFYPCFHIRKFMILRKRIKNNPGCLSFTAQSGPTSKE